MTTAGIVLAAGAGTRFGRPKATVELDGELLVVRAARVLREAGCDPVIAVVGEVAVEVPGADDVVRNPDWASGLGASLRAGLAAARRWHARRALVVLADQPWLGAPVVRAVLDAAPDRTDALAAATFGGRRSHPVLLGTAHWAGAGEAAVGDIGARAYLDQHADELLAVPVDGLGDPRDVDHPEDLLA